MSVTSPWKVEALEPVNLNDIMNEEYARTLQQEEVLKCSDDPGGAEASIDVLSSEATVVKEQETVEPLPPEVIEALLPVAPPTGIPKEVLDALKDEPDFKQLADLDSDAKIASLLQEQFDREHDNYVKCVEKANNKNSKVQVSLSKFRVVPEGILQESDDEDAEAVAPEDCKDWDRFETNEREGKMINKRTGYSVNEKGVLKTKHDSDISGRRNACKMMSFPPDISTGDAGSFDMKLSNAVFNQLRSHTKQMRNKYNKASDRKEDMATAVMGIDEPTRLILYKFINSQLLESVDGVISTGKEAVVLHAFTDPGYPEREDLPKEVAVKIFSTTLNEFKQRDRYIKDDYRFKDRFSKQNARTVIHMWAEKEFHNLNRLKRNDILCPETIALKKHVLIMSFIGKDSMPAKKLKDAILSDADWSVAYENVLDIMHKMYNSARLVHADFSEYNLLWYDQRCWVIDVAQAVEPIHPGAYEFLMRDCGNIVTFFSKKGVPNTPTKEQLFFSITGLDPLTHNTQMLERIHMKGAPAHIINAVMTETGEVPEQFKPLVYPFEVAWEKVDELRKREDDAPVELTDALKELKYQEI